MEYKCINCEVTFEVNFLSEAKDSCADVYYCPHCSQNTLQAND